MGKTPFRHDRSASRDDPGRSMRRQWNVGQPDACMDREIVDPLLRLLDQSVTIDLPGQFFSFSTNLFECLIDGNGSDRNRRIADDPFASRVDILSCREIHNSVGAASCRISHLVDLFLDRGGNGGITDIGVDLDQEVTADRHRLDLRMVDVRWNDRSPARNLVTHKLRRNLSRQCCPKTLSPV